MHKTFRLPILVLSFLLAALAACSSLSGRGSHPLTLTVLHMNDTHGHLLPYMEKSLGVDYPVSGSAYVADRIRGEREVNPDGTVLLSAGDMFQGTPVSNVFRGKPVIEFMNYMAFDAMTLGNHEFDWGTGVLADMVRSASFPFLAGNIEEVQAGKLPPGLKPFVVLTRKGVKVAIIGATTTEAPYATKPDNVTGIAFRDPEQTIPGLIEKAKEAGATVTIVLSHLGLEADKALAASARGIDVIVGGHSHTIMDHPVYVGQTAIVQAGFYGVYLGVLKLKIDSATGTVLGPADDYALQLVTARPTDPYENNVAGIVGKYNDRIKTEFAKVVGEARVDLIRQNRAESNIGNLISDVLREAAGAQVAFQNGGGIRSDLPAGKITFGDAYTILPFDNALVAMDLTGSQILDILEQNVADSDSRILQVSGLEVRYDLDKPALSRVVSVRVGSKPLLPDKTYRVATNDFLAAGGDRLHIFTQGKNIVFADPVRDLFVTHIQRKSPVGPKVEKRISFVN